MAATEAHVKRALENALGLAPNALDGAINTGASILGQIQGVNDRINVVETEVTSRVPKFAGKEDEDVEEHSGEIISLCHDR